MRKILAIGFIIAGVVISCQKEEITPTTTPVVSISKDCNCNRVAKVFEYNVQGKMIYDCWMINDCSQVQTFKTYYNKVKIGECKN